MRLDTTTIIICMIGLAIALPLVMEIAGLTWLIVMLRNVLRGGDAEEDE